VDRRAFIAWSLGLLGAPLVAEGQSVTKVHRIGVLLARADDVIQ